MYHKQVHTHTQTHTHTGHMLNVNVISVADVLCVCVGGGACVVLKELGLFLFPVMDCC